MARNELANEDVTNGASMLGLERNREEAVEEKSLIKESEGGGDVIVESDEFPSNGGVIEEEMMNGVEMKAEPVVKKERTGYALNAKIKKESDSALSATAGWQAVRSGGNGSIGGGVG